MQGAKNILAGVKDRLGAERTLASLLLVSLVIKVALLFSGDIINKDGVRYIDAARQFAAGNFQSGLSIEKMPFYPLLIVAFQYLVGDWVLAGKLISLISLVLALVPLYWLSKGLFDGKVAFWAGLAFVLSPMLNGLAVDLIRDPIFLFFVLWAVYFFWRATTEHKGRFYVLTSVAIILAFFCRIEGVFLFAFFFLALLLFGLKNRTERRSLFKGMAILLSIPLVLGLLSGGALMLFAGINLASLSRFGEPMMRLQSVLNGDFLDMYHHLYEHLRAYKNPLYVWKTGSFAETARHYLPVIYLISLTEALARNLFLLYVIPLWVGLFGKGPALNRGHWQLLGLSVTYFMVAYYFLFTHDFISKRYVLVPALLLYPWAGRGLEKLWTGISRSRYPRVAMVLFLLFFCAAPAYKSLSDLVEPDKDGVIRDTGQWLSMQPQLQNAVIASDDPRLRFYLSENLKSIQRMKHAHVAQDFLEIERVAIENDADILVIEISRKNQKLVPEFKEFYLEKEMQGIDNKILIYSNDN